MRRGAVECLAVHERSPTSPDLCEASQLRSMSDGGGQCSRTRRPISPTELLQRSISKGDTFFEKILRGVVQRSSLKALAGSKDQRM